MYECHITIDPVSIDQRESLQAAVEEFGFRLAKLLMQNGETPSQLDTFMTAKSKDYGRLYTNAEDCIIALRLMGIVIRRVKIEYMVLDTKYGSTIGGINGAVERSAGETA